MKQTLRFLLLLSLFIGLIAASSLAQESTDEPEMTPETSPEATVETTATPEATSTTQAPVNTGAEATPEATEMMEIERADVEIIDADVEGVGAFVRILHLASSGANVDVYIDEELSDTADLAFTEGGNWLVLPAGTHSFTIRAAGDDAQAEILSFEVNLVDNEPLIIALVDGDEGALTALLVRDNYDDVAPGVGTLNFLNALNSENGVNFLRDEVVFVSAVNPGGEDLAEISNSIDVDASEYTFTATYFGTDEPVDTEALELDVRDEDNYLIVLAGTESEPQLLVFETRQADVNLMRGAMESPGTVLDVLRARGYESFVTMLEEAGLADTLTGEGPYTLFVPADYLLDELAASDEEMSVVLQNYIVEGDWRSSDFATEEVEIMSIGGNSYQLGFNGSALGIGNAQIIDVNIPATNGTIHIINDLLFSHDWPELTPEATAEATENAGN